MWQRNERGVRELLEKADKTAEEKKGEEDVYEAMALSLSEAWKMLASHLEKRRSLLQLACHFYDHALEVRDTSVQSATRRREHGVSE